MIERTLPLLDPEVPGLNPLLRAAQPLLEWVPALKRLDPPPDQRRLRDQLISMINTFCSDARRSGLKDEQLAVARYCLCTFLDEAIASTPWGAGAWGGHSLLVTFHNETSGGERFFQILQWLAQRPEAHLSELELLSVLLALGMEGRYRLIDGGRGELERLRERLYLLIREQRDVPDPALSPHWKGATARLQHDRRWRRFFWSTLTAAGGLLLLALWFASQLRDNTRPLMAALNSLQVQPHNPPPAAPAFSPRLTPLLADEIRQNRLSVDENTQRAIITLHVDSLFASGRSQVLPGNQALLRAIAGALRATTGKVVVTGHSDDQATAPGAPDNWALSLARANAVVSILVRDTGQPERFLAQGRGATEPLAPNDTVENRAKNRRVVITVLPPGVAL